MAAAAGFAIQRLYRLIAMLQGLVAVVSSTGSTCKHSRRRLLEPAAAIADEAGSVLVLCLALSVRRTNYPYAGSHLGALGSAAHLGFELYGMNIMTNAQGSDHIECD